MIFNFSAMDVEEQTNMPMSNDELEILQEIESEEEESV